MKEAIKNNKKIIIIGVFIIVLLLIGITYAYLRTTLEGQKEYVIRAGTLDLVLGEGNELTLEKQKPIEDEEGMSLDGFTFSLTNNGNIESDYTIYLDDIELEGTLLNTRYSGEYIRFGSGENNLYRIVSHENGTGTKITSAEPLKSRGTFVTSSFGETVTYSSTNTIGTFLNNDYLNIENGYLTNNDIAMIEDNITWYLGTINNGSSYKLAKYTDTNMTGYTSTINSKVGLLRYGELMAGQFNRNVEKGETYNRTNLTIYYWTLTPYTSSYVWTIGRQSSPTAFSSSNSLNEIKPALNLKSNVIITGGGGTKENPFTLQLAS